jgi:hypothetical protein
MKQLPLLSLLVLFLSACGVTPTPVDTSLDETWNVVISESLRNTFDIESVNVTEDEDELGIDVIYGLKQLNITKGFVFQATVDGDGGKDSVVFRLSVFDNQFKGFSILSHREHTNFGVKQFNALNAQLVGTQVIFSEVVAILQRANAGRTGISVTYDGLMPAIEAMVERYLAV